MPKMKIRVSFFFVLMLISLIWTHSYLSLAALFAAFLHEMGHLTAAKLCGVRIEELKLDIFGASLKVPRSLCSYGKEMLLCISGPLVNILSALTVLCFSGRLSEFGRCFLLASLFLGILNLLPVKDFDGGRVLYCMVERFISPSAAYRVETIFSFCIIFVLWLLSVYLILCLSATLSLLIFSMSLFARIFLSESR